METQAVRDEDGQPTIPLVAWHTPIRRKILLVHLDSYQETGGGPDISTLKNHLTEEGQIVSVFDLSRSAKTRLHQLFSAGPLESLQHLTGRLHQLYRAVVSHDVILLVAAPPMELANSLIPTLLLARFFGKQVIVSFAGGNVEDLDGKLSRVLMPVLRLASQVTVPTEWSARVLAKHHLPINVLPTVLDADRISPRLIQEVQPKILTYILAGPESNVTALLRAVKIAKSKYPRVELTLVGTPERLDQASNFGGLEGSINFLEPRNSDALQACWGSCDILVHNSSDDDLPTPVLKALALGIPVISCDSGGMTSVLQHGKSGLLFPTNDPAALAGQIISLIEQPHLVTQLSRSGPLEAYRFAWGSVRGRWISLFNRYSN